MRAYSEPEIHDHLNTLPGWTYNGTALEKQWIFADFSQAFGFMARIALIAETLGHHPDWSNVYNRLTIRLHTHDAGGITDLDFEFAKRVEGLIP
jgi:4a-hydroxytetrahydrobiopterin dehydratase